MNFLIAYDISDPRRLRRVARALERHALRCQKSVFLFTGDDDRVQALLDRLAMLIQPKVDCIQAWKLRGDQPRLGMIRGAPLKIHPGCVVLHAGQPRLVDASDP